MVKKELKKFVQTSLIPVEYMYFTGLMKLESGELIADRQ